MRICAASFVGRLCSVRCRSMSGLGGYAGAGLMLTHSGSRRFKCCALRDAYSITSSARATRVGGTSSPSAFAVLRLITNSYFVGTCTGRSAGFFTLEDAIDVAGRAAILVALLGAV
jgi:hypothetical protein